MKDDITSLKPKVAELLVVSNRLLSLVKEVKTEAAGSPDQSLYEGAAYWSDLVRENMANVIRKITQAAKEKDPGALAHSVNSFMSLGRYINDYDYTWCTKHDEIRLAVVKITGTAGAVYRLINVFDPKNIESAKDALM